MTAGTRPGHARAAGFLRYLRLAVPKPVLVVTVLLAGCTGSQAESGTATESSSNSPAAPSVSSAEGNVELQAAVDEASAYAASQGVNAGIAIIDREARTEVVNAGAGTPIRTASLVKLFITDNLLQRQRSGEFQLSEQDRLLIESMLVFSDDSAAESLYGRFGQEAMVIEVAQRYGLVTLLPASPPAEWELTSVSPIDLARYYDLFLRQTPAVDRDYVVGLLRRASPIATDGFSQVFGLANGLAGGTAGIKQGWMCCPDGNSYLHSTGIVGADNRYSLAIFTVEPNRSLAAYRTDVLDGIATLVFQSGISLD
ncbi:MAG: class A beta-lactamase-related serine hydrolase [Actinomycetota bacterium]|nr:class A beta-lactamase-related serine hydrolase [Actinomycetota bacterium]